MLHQLPPLAPTSAFFGAVVLLPVAALHRPADPPPDSAVAICTPEHVFAAKDRVHVRCIESHDGILFFAAPTDEQGRATQVVHLGFQAIAKGGRLRISYDPADKSGASWGCLVHDCRPALTIQPLPKGKPSAP